jgi:hypothetical protein
VPFGPCGKLCFLAEKVNLKVGLFGAFGSPWFSLVLLGWSLLCSCITIFHRVSTLSLHSIVYTLILYCYSVLKHCAHTSCCLHVIAFALLMYYYIPSCVHSVVALHRVHTYIWLFARSHIRCTHIVRSLYVALSMFLVSALAEARMETSWHEWT